jgi:oxygen-independent coproporphyrinogen-3 oxidase
MAVVQDLAHFMRPGSLQLGALPPLSLYVHLPWCLRKCPYCDFNSHAITAGDMPEQAYLEALVADLEASLALVWGRTVHSIFIGGGTPSLFSPKSIDRLLADIRARLRLAADCEITLEANPGTFERDLMYALPGQTMADMEQDMATALAMDSPHISIYHLTIEPNTYFAKFPPALPDDDSAYEMLDRISALTQAAGLQRYEVSAYARAGHRCWHNLNYWQFGDYLGIGAGAHSKLSFAHRIVRQARHRDPRLYMEKARAMDCVASSDEVPRADLPFEFMLNAMRLKEGIPLAHFMERTGLPISALEVGLAQAESAGLVLRDLVRVVPTTRGFDFLNDLQSMFLPPARP